MTEPLRTDELRELRQGRKRILGFWGALLIAAPVAALFPAVLDVAPETARNLRGTVIAGLLIAGLLKLSERCPRCGAIPGFGARGALPPRCRRCGVSFGEG